MWTWYAAVRARTSLSDDALDKRFLDSENRRLRYFHRIRHLGHTPKKRPRSGPGDGTLVDRVERDPDFRGTAKFYNSPFWTLVGPRSLDLHETRELLFQFTKEHGLYRASTEACNVARHFGVTDRAFEDPPQHALQKALKPISKRADIEDLALLGLQFREALLLCELEPALLLKTALSQAIINFKRRFPLSDMAEFVLDLLVARRIFRNEVYVPLGRGNMELYVLDLDKHAGTGKQSKRRPLNRMEIRSFTVPNMNILYENDLNDVRRPWVSINPTLRVFIDNFYALQDETDRVDGNRWYDKYIDQSIATNRNVVRKLKRLSSPRIDELKRIKALLKQSRRT